MDHWVQLSASGSQRCCQWVDYSKTLIVQSNGIYICCRVLAVICPLNARFLFVFQILKRLCWFVPEIYLDGAHKAYLLTFDIFTGWVTKWKIRAAKFHKWHLSLFPEVMTIQLPAVSGTPWQRTCTHSSAGWGPCPYLLRAHGPAEASRNPSICSGTYCLKGVKCAGVILWCLYSREM